MRKRTLGGGMNIFKSGESWKRTKVLGRGSTLQQPVDEQSQLSTGQQALVGTKLTGECRRLPKYQPIAATWNAGPLRSQEKPEIWIFM